MDEELERFRTCAQAYGADARRWPAADRALHARHAASPAGAAILADAERTDAFLDALGPAGADTGALADRILAEAGGARRPPRRPWAWPAAAFAASALLGFAIGYLEPPAFDLSAQFVGHLLLGPTGEIGL